MIDVHHHILPPPYMVEARERIVASVQGGSYPDVMDWSPQKAIAEMDRTNIATAVVSISTTGIWFGNTQKARDLARKCNDYGASLVRDYPGRFGLFAPIPLPDIEGSLREIEYVLDEVKADGIGLLSSYGDKWLGDQTYAPVLEELNRRNAIIYVHPASPNCCRNLVPNVPQSLIEFPQDTARTVMSLMYSGTFARLRNIRFIFAHAGGTIPILAGRIRALAPALNMEKDIEADLRRHYFDIASAASRSSMAALMNVVPTTQILFGTDYPYVPVAATTDELRKLSLSVAEIQAITRNNAMTLIPRLKT